MEGKTEKKKLVALKLKTRRKFQIAFVRIEEHFYTLTGMGRDTLLTFQ